MSYMNHFIDQKRRDDRVPLRVHATLRERGGSKYEVTVFDLSRSGCRCEVLFATPPGSIIWIQIPGMAPIQTEIVWREGFLAGCKFATPLHPAIFDNLLKKF
jgi:hypothetical protein